MEAVNDILAHIREARISTEELSDCLGKTGVITGLKPLRRGHHAVGRIFLAWAHGASNHDLHRQLTRVQAGDVVLVKQDGCGDRALFGELVTRFLVEQLGAAGVVVDGAVRDVAELVNADMPVWCKDVTPLGCFNRPAEAPLDDELRAAWQAEYDGAVAVCDDSGVVVLRREQLCASLEKMAFLRLQEDIWRHCILQRGWSTWETICLKRYLQESEVLPADMRERLEYHMNAGTAESVADVAGNDRLLRVVSKRLASP